MKVHQHLLCCAVVVLLYGLLSLAKADGPLDKAVPDYELDIGVQKQVDQYPAVESKIKYLSSLVAEKEDSSNITNNIRKSSAILLLGKIGDTNVIDILVTNLTYFDKCHNGYPACRALIGIGEKAVPQLLEVLKDSNDEKKISFAASTIGLIESRSGNWKEFGEQQKKTLPKKAWDRLMRYVVVVSP